MSYQLAAVPLMSVTSSRRPVRWGGGGPVFTTITSGVNPSYQLAALDAAHDAGAFYRLIVVCIISRRPEGLGRDLVVVTVAGGCLLHHPFLRGLCNCQRLHLSWQSAKTTCVSCNP